MFKTCKIFIQSFSVGKHHSKQIYSRLVLPKTILWNRDITKCQGNVLVITGVRYIGSLTMHSTITGPKNIVLYTGVFVTQGFVLPGFQTTNIRSYSKVMCSISLQYLHYDYMNSCFLHPYAAFSGLSSSRAGVEVEAYFKCRVFAIEQT